MSNHFFTPLKLKIIPEKVLNPLLTPIKYVGYALGLLVIFNLIFYVFNSEMFSSKINVTLFMFTFMFLFSIRRTGHRPLKVKNELKFIRKNLFYFFLSILIFTLIAYMLLICNYDDISPLQRYTLLKASFHLSIIWIFLPFFFNYILSRFGIDIPYKFFLNMHTATLQDTNLFSSTKQLTEHHEKDEIYIDIIQQTEVPHSKIEKQDYLKIQNMYLRLIKFWYAQKNYKFRLRSSFSILISIGSILYFFYLLDFMHNVQESSHGDILGIQSMGVIAISLTILYFTMSYHINSFLNSEFYSSSILKELNKVYFDKHNHRQQLKLFLDKNFLVYIHDKHHDNHFCVNESQDFQNFISNKEADEEGRNLIIMVYISFFMILFIETSTGDLLNSPDNNDTKTHIHDKKENIKHDKQAPQFH
ncbi:MAG TPA: hypothetical protein EYG73_00970 [Arcobacter sp.]|nr:hypothetical protein [Arcobacter sp.]